jgi:hypothetical protein
MPLGLFAPMPLRLGGSAEEGWTAAQHARACADLVALKKSAFLAIWTYTKSGGIVTIHDYYGLNGAGSAYAPDQVFYTPSFVTFGWSNRLFEDPYQVTHPINAKSGKACGHGSASIRTKVTIIANGLEVRAYDSAGVDVDGKFTVFLI